MKIKSAKHRHILKIIEEMNSNSPTAYRHADGLNDAGLSCRNCMYFRHDGPHGCLYNKRLITIKSGVGCFYFDLEEGTLDIDNEMWSLL
jgi:hypothetical protein